MIISQLGAVYFFSASTVHAGPSTKLFKWGLSAELEPFKQGLSIHCAHPS